MRTILSILLFAGLIVTCNNCERGEKISLSDPLDYSDIVIKSGYICGWGHGTDSLLIAKNIIKYFYYIPDENIRPQIISARSVSETEWNDIKRCIKMTDFVKLNYHSCNICVDGCDEWLSIQDGNIFHKITFGYGYKIDSISELQDRLLQIRAEFRNSRNRRLNQ